jgi:hypothetical protein
VSARAYAAFQAICRHADELADISQQEIKEHRLAFDWCRAELTAIEDLCRGAGLDGSVLSMVQTLARSVDAERVLREAHKVTVEENARLREQLRTAVDDTIRHVHANFAMDWDIVDDPTADGNRAAEARQRIRDALKGKVTT